MKQVFPYKVSSMIYCVCVVVGKLLRAWTAHVDYNQLMLYNNSFCSNFWRFSRAIYILRPYTALYLVDLLKDISCFDRTCIYTALRNNEVIKLTHYEADSINVFLSVRLSDF